MLSRKQLRELREAPLVGSNKLRKAIDLAEKTQVDVAAAVGITQSYVSLIERGERTNVTLELARLIAGYFGCDVDDIFPASEEAKAS
jgi:DNA-binding XRE family transcriptional regulator